MRDDKQEEGTDVSSAILEAWREEEELKGTLTDERKAYLAACTYLSLLPDQSPEV